MIEVLVPATSANLGVGFDTLGMALDLKARFTFEPSDTLEICGCEERFRGPDNLVWTTFVQTLRELKHDVRPVRLTIDSPIPLSGGLGSSSTCVVAGVAAAQALCGIGFDREHALDIATHVEGHPDNVAPAIMGGLVSSFVRANETISCHFDVDPSLRFVAIAPPYEVRTEDARKVLPDRATRETCVWQMGRCVATVRALETGDTHLLSLAAQDRIHEPYRKRLIADYEPLRAAALNAGADAYLISGSGSTMLAICEDDETAEAVAHAAHNVRDGLWVHVMSADAHGATVTGALD